jgi:ParB family transcriptional regulator, chromosome partitioning protein
MGIKDNLAARFGKNVMESMGAGGAGGFVLPSGAIPGESAKYQGCTRVKAALLIETDRVAPDPNQPRKEFEGDALERLAESLKERGQLQPIRVRWDATMERWAIIAGERRWRAAVLAGLPAVMAVEATSPLTEDEILEEQLVENCLREDLKPIEQAKAYKALLARRGLSQRQLAERLHVGQATIAKALALLNLPESIQVSVDAGEIGPSEAYQLTKIEDPAEQDELAQEAKAGRLKRDEIQERTRTPRNGRGAAKGKGKTRLPAELRRRGPSGCRVVIHTATRHTLADVAADLQAIADQLRAESAGDGQAAA